MKSKKPKDNKRLHKSFSLSKFGDVELLNAKIAEESPPSGILYYKHLTPEYEKQLNIPMGAET